MLGSGFSSYQRNPTKKKRNIFQQLLESQKEEEEIAYPRGFRTAAMPRERGQTISPVPELSQRNSGQWRGGRRERRAARELAPRDHRTRIPSSQRATGSRIPAVTVPSCWTYWTELKPPLLVRVHGRLLTDKMGLRWENGRRISDAVASRTQSKTRLVQTDDVGDDTQDSLCEKWHAPSRLTRSAVISSYFSSQSLNYFNQINFMVFIFIPNIRLIEL